MKLWDKGYDMDKWAEDFTVGKDRELDVHLAKWDVLGSMAHARMLAAIGLLGKEELTDLERELSEILKLIGENKFIIEEGTEDVHSQVELILTRKLGDTGKKIHSGRSRNDQVLLDLRLYLRNEIRVLTEDMENLSRVLLELASRYSDHLMPGYTHMQVAMPSSFGLWFSSFAESLAEDLYVLQASWRVANQNPLGSAAGYGSSFPLDREMTTRLLGFEQLSYNVIAAQAGRGKSEKLLSYAMSSTAATLGRLSMDICTYSGQNFGFFHLPEEITTGSSIMPHKKNPDIFEIMRGRCNRLQALPATITQMLGNLTTGYHRDLQLIKEEIVPAIHEMRSCLRMAAYALPLIEINDSVLNNPMYEHLFTVEEVNKLVLSGVPFRDAYREVGKMLETGTFSTDRKLSHSHAGSIGQLSLDKIQAKISQAIAEFHFEKVDMALGALMPD